MRHILCFGFAIAALTALGPAAQAAPLAGASALSRAAAVSPESLPALVRWQRERERYSSRRHTRSTYRTASSSRGGVYWGGHYWSGPGYKCK